MAFNIGDTVKIRTDLVCNKMYNWAVPTNHDYYVEFGYDNKVLE